MSEGLGINTLSSKYDIREGPILNHFELESCKAPVRFKALELKTEFEALDDTEQTKVDEEADNTDHLDNLKVGIVNLKSKNCSQVSGSKIVKSKTDKMNKQAGAELSQAQPKLGLGILLK